MINYHRNLVQQTEEWYAARCGLLTASEMKLIITPATLKIANNQNQRAHLYELLGQRITNHVEPSFDGWDIARGREEEILAKKLYNSHYEATEDCGFITNDEWGFTLGFSPDGLVGDDGFIEAKSRKQKFQIETIVESSINGEMPGEFVIQVQTGLLVSGRKWCDFITYCNGLNMVTVRILPDEKIQAAIIDAATAFEKALAQKLVIYHAFEKSDIRQIAVERLNYNAGEIQV